MKRLLSAERLNELAKLVGEWADIQFKIHLPALGFLEEVGEAAHCLIKHAQKIRGFEDEAFFKEHLKDAIADAAIYLFHLCHRKLIRFPGGSLAAEGATPIANEEDAVYALTLCAADFVNPQQELAAIIQSVNDATEMLATLALIHDIDFDEAVEETWAKVSKRDWANNPKDADVKAGEKGGHKPGK